MRLILTNLRRCLWSSSARSIYGLGALSRQLEAIPNVASRVSCRARCTRRNGVWCVDDEGLDCTLDRPLLLPLGYWLCEKVGFGNRNVFTWCDNKFAALGTSPLSLQSANISRPHGRPSLWISISSLCSSLQVFISASANFGTSRCL